MSIRGSEAAEEEDVGIGDIVIENVGEVVSFGGSCRGIRRLRCHQRCAQQLKKCNSGTCECESLIGVIGG